MPFHASKNQLIEESIIFEFFLFYLLIFEWEQVMAESRLFNMQIGTKIVYKKDRR